MITGQLQVNDGPAFISMLRDLTFLCTMNLVPLSTLKRGDRGTIVEITNPEAVAKLMEMGCLPGEEFVLENIAPLGDPLAIQLAGNKVSFRKSEAACFLVSQDKTT